MSFANDEQTRTSGEKGKQKSVDETHPKMPWLNIYKSNARRTQILLSFVPSKNGHLEKGFIAGHGSMVRSKICNEPGIKLYN